MNKKYLFKDVVVAKGGFLRGPFGGDLKKEIFVEKGIDTYKVYEQGVVLNSDKNIGRYYISEKDYKAKLHKFSVEDRDFLVSCSGVNMGAIYQLRLPFERGIINQALLRIRLNQEVIDDDYFIYLFKELISLKITTGSGDSTIPNFPGIDIIKNITFELPEKDTQTKIGKILSSLDSKIKINNKINAELEAVAKTLYDYWFVQFDFPNDKGKPYKTSGGKMVWNEKLKREIQEGWEVNLFSDWIKNDKSGDWGRENVEGNYTERVHCIRGADINGMNGTGDLKPPVRFILEKNMHKILEPYDLIVEISGGSPTQSTGRLAYVTSELLTRFDAPIICSNFCKAVTLKDKSLFYNFVYHWKAIYDAGVLFGYEGKTSGIKNLLFDSFVSSHYTVMPNMAVAKKFYNVENEIEIKKQKNLKENQKLVELRDWLLPMLMNGQIKVN
jgi:type I restriction enzyme S subunit